MIHAERLSRRFGPFLAVEDVSVDVADGTLLALLGPNGAGKTTTVRMLSGLLAPTSGCASVAGCDVASEAPEVRMRVGLVTDVPGLYEQMSVTSYLDFFGRLYGVSERKRATRIDALLEMFDLRERRHDRMVTFSRGMQQKVALARALLHEPAVLFLDEPTSGLDPLAARAVRELILSLKHARRAIVLCTHDLDEAERLADQVAILRGGRILAMDTPEALRHAASPDTRVRVSLAPPFPPSVPTGVLDFQTPAPQTENPRVVAELVSSGARIVSVTCASAASLEDVYAKAIDGHRNGTPFPNSALVRSIASTKPVQSPTSAVSSIGDWAAAWLIARRAAVESLTDRMTRIMNVFFAVVAPVALLLLVVRPLRAADPADIASLLPFYLLVIGTMPAVGAVGIASGQFAGERERGVLTPMLASPASNLAIFVGKVLGSILPPTLYSLIAQVIYLVGVGVLLGLDRLALLPPALILAMLVLVPASTCLAAIIGTLVSSRVRTYNAAQQISGILLVPLWALLFGVGFRLQEWGYSGIIASVGGLVLLDAVLTRVAAATWRREEVLSHR
jgi:ABC-2 type transport system ATP-binding protein